jgi:hypothetical protein
MSKVEPLDTKWCGHPMSAFGASGEGRQPIPRPILSTDGARRRLRRDIAALIGRMREYLATASEVDCSGFIPVATPDRVKPAENSPTREPATETPRHSEREHRQLTNRFGPEVQRVLALAQTLGVTDAAETSAIKAGLASTLTLHGAAAGLEALARRI